MGSRIDVLEKVINNLLNVYIGGEAFFNHLDETIKNTLPIMEEFLNSIPNIENKHIIMSGGFSEVFDMYLKSVKIRPRTIICTIGGLRKGNKINLINEDIHNKEFIFLDDSYYSGSTRNVLANELSKYGSKITDTYVVYDGSHVKEPNVHSLYRYYK